MAALVYTQHALDKLENIMKMLGYQVRYEKGNFKTGACILKNSKIIIVNKFSNLESKLIALAGLLEHIGIDEMLLDEKQKQFLHSLKNQN